MRYDRFDLERWQSTYEHEVRFNLSESGVQPLSVSELLELAGTDAAEAGLLDARLGYAPTNGSAHLREAVADLYDGVSPEGVLVTSGGAEANFVSLWRLLEPGEAAAVVMPSYMQGAGLATSFGGRVLPVPLLEEEGWLPDLEALRGAVADGARFILVTNPNNPTGAVLPEEAMEAVVDAAASAGAWILADEVYRGAELNGRETSSFLGRYERVLVTGSLSKAYGLPGLRVGWVAGPEDAVSDLWARTDYTTIAPASLSDSLATLALREPTRSRILERTRSILRENLPVIEAWARELGELVRLRPPQAGAIAYVRLRTGSRTTDLVERVRVEKDVLLVPGEHFGMDGFVRIGYGEPRSVLEEALGRVAEVIREES